MVGLTDILRIDTTYHLIEGGFDFPCFNQLRDLLLTREVIFTEDVEHIFGKRPWLSRSQEIMEDEQPKIDEAVKELPEVQAAIKEHEAAKKNAEDSEKETPANESNEENPNENNNGKNNE